MTTFNTLADVTAAVDAGKTVCWKSVDYTVGRDILGQYHVTYRAHSRNPNSVGLFHRDGVGSEYTPGEFYIRA